jgi:molybdopterin/thiamine biosynthesis adenylyltransferase
MLPTLKQKIDDRSRAAKMDDGTPCRVITDHDVRRLSAEEGIAGRIVEASALDLQIVPTRYLRNMKTLSMDDQRRLLQASVCIVGLGGLGGLVTESLARMGVGRLKLIDGDTVETHNLNRQLLSTTDSIGAAKAEVAAMRVAAVNPGVEVTPHALYLAPENASTLIENSELAIDCLDTIPGRFTLESAARQAGIPMISAAVAGLSGHVTTIFPEDVGLENIYGTIDSLSPPRGEETRMGCLAPVVNVIASLESNEALNVLLAKKNTLQNRLLVVDLTDYSIETLQLS